MPPSNLKPLIQLTTDTIAQRTKWHRNVIIAIVTIGLGASASALVVGSWELLVGLLLVIPVVLVSMMIDLRLTHTWQNQLLEAWRRGNINLATLAQGLRAMHGLPPRTLESMLHTLPLDGLTNAWSGPLQETKQAIITCANELSSYESMRIRSTTLVFALATGIVIATGLARSMETAFLLIGVIPVYAGGWFVARSHRRRIRQTLDAMDTIDDPHAELARTMVYTMMKSRLSARDQLNLLSRNQR